MDENILPESTAVGCASCNSPAVEEGYPTPLCRECRQRFIKFPIPRWIIIFAVAIGALIVFSLFSFPRNLSVALHYERGKQAIEKRHFVTAQAELAEFLQDVPDNVEAEGYMMLAAFYNNDLETVIGEGRKIANKDLDNDKLLGDLNRLADFMPEYYPGDSLQFLMVKYPDSTGGVPDTALTRYASHHPEEVFTLITYASRLYKQKQYQVCDSVLKIVLLKDQLFLPALHMNIGVQRELGNWEAALRSCDDILRINGEASYAIAGKAGVFLKQYKDKEALQFAQTAMKMNPRDPYAVCSMILAAHFTHEWKERDALIKSAKASGNADLKEALTYAEDVISGKEVFRK